MVPLPTSIDKMGTVRFETCQEKYQRMWCSMMPNDPRVMGSYILHQHILTLIYYVDYYVNLTCWQTLIYDFNIETNVEWNWISFKLNCIVTSSLTAICPVMLHWYDKGSLFDCTNLVTYWNMCNLYFILIYLSGVYINTIHSVQVHCTTLT